MKRPSPKDPIIIPNSQIEARIRLRGDRDVHLLRVKAEELDPHSEGACGLQGEIQGFTGDPITCEGCIRWLERHAVEVSHQALRAAKGIQADVDRILKGRQA